MTVCNAMDEERLLTTYRMYCHDQRCRLRVKRVKGDLWEMMCDPRFHWPAGFRNHVRLERRGGGAKRG